MQTVIDAHHLQVEIDAKECRIADDERTLMQPDLERIGQAVHEFPASQLWIMIVYHPNSRRHHAQAKLKLPGETIITGGYDDSLLGAFRQCMGKVLRRIEAYRLHPNHEAVDKAERDARLANVIAPTEPDAGTLGQALRNDDYSAFRHALLSHEEWVRMRVGRWVQRFPDVQDQIGRSFEIADIVEEVFLLAFEHYADRPGKTPLKDWLEDLIDPAVKSFWRNPEETLNETRAAQEYP